jgi:hypothetical protein
MQELVILKVPSAIALAQFGSHRAASRSSIIASFQVGEVQPLRISRYERLPQNRFRSGRPIGVL